MRIQLITQLFYSKRLPIQKHLHRNTSPLNVKGIVVFFFKTGLYLCQLCHKYTQWKHFSESLLIYLT